MFRIANTCVKKRLTLKMALYNLKPSQIAIYNTIFMCFVI